jgi:hypothetical protein
MARPDAQRPWGAHARVGGKYSRAESLLVQALQVHRRSLGEENLQTRQSARHRVTLYQRWDRPAEAAAFREMLDGN